MSEVYAEHFALDASRGNLGEAYQTIERVRGQDCSRVIVHEAAPR